MDQQRRLLTFTVLSFLILFGWMSLGRSCFPGMFPQPQKPVKKLDPKAEEAVVDEKDADENKGDKGDKPAGMPPLSPNSNCRIIPRKMS